MVLDRNSEYLGVTTLQLMENAGRSVADEIATRFGKGAAVAIYGGTGRNGGDGMVAARHLAGRGFDVTFRLIGDEEAISDPNTQKNWRTLKALSSVKIEALHDSSQISAIGSDVVVDAILGTGVKGKLRQPVVRAVEAVNESRAFKLAVDVPTGIDSDTGEVLGVAVRANLTVTLHAAKTGFSKTKQFCGEIKVADIGIPPDAALRAGPGDVEAAVVKRAPDAHKGEFGRLLVVGGSGIYSGAPTFVGLGAYRAGTDLVFVAAPEKAAQAAASISPSLITIKLPGDKLGPSHLRILHEHLQKASAVALGPGLGLARETASAARRIVTTVVQMKKPMLIDADALKALGVIRKKIFNESTVITPHAGEFQSISGKPPSKDLKTRARDVRDFAAKCGCVVILKGHTDIISNGTRVKFNNTGNPGMTVGGTGDVLSGIVAGLMAQGVNPFRAAVAGTFVNGAAGDLAAERLGYHLTPTDMLDHIPQVLNNPMSHRPILEKRLAS